MKRPPAVALVLAAVLAAGALALWWRSPPPAPVASAPPAAPAAAPTGPAPAASAPSAPSLTDAPSAPSTIDPPADSAALAADEVVDSLERLLGRKTVLTLLQIDDFPRRVVATVDNLGRAHASPSLWPVTPTPGRFAVLQQADGPVLSPDNGMRYTPLVLLIETVDIARAVDLYARMYPLLQRAYEDLGYPRRSFNDRLIEVIDLLLTTPEPEQPVKLDLLKIQGDLPSQRPWVNYRFADPALESLAAGQKMLIRTGPVNARRLKAKLLEFGNKIAARSRSR